MKLINIGRKLEKNVREIAEGFDYFGLFIEDNNLVERGLLYLVTNQDGKVYALGGRGMEVGETVDMDRLTLSEKNEIAPIYPHGDDHSVEGTEWDTRDIKMVEMVGKFDLDEGDTIDNWNYTLRPIAMLGGVTRISEHTHVSEKEKLIRAIDNYKGWD